jgi:hypothetical protein
VCVLLSVHLFLRVFFGVFLFLIIIITILFLVFVGWDFGVFFSFSVRSGFGFFGALLWVVVFSEEALFVCLFVGWLVCCRWYWQLVAAAALVVVTVVAGQKKKSKTKLGAACVVVVLLTEVWQFVCALACLLVGGFVFCFFVAYYACAGL